MAIQTKDGITTPGLNDPFQIVSQLSTLAETTQQALDKRANTRVGTSAQREASIDLVPEGTLWVDTNGDKALYTKQGPTWKRIWPEIVSPRVYSFLRSQSGFTSHPDATHYIQRRGEWVYINWVFRTTKAISVPSSTGNITNLTAAILDEEWRPKTWQPLHGGNESGRMWGVTLGSNGHIRLNSVGGTSNVGVNQTGQIRGWYNMEL